MPSEQLNWSPNSDVTLIGDAAHVTPPWVGDGANCAMRDSVILARNLQKHGLDKTAVAEYEKDMFRVASDVIIRSLASGVSLSPSPSPSPTPAPLPLLIACRFQRLRSAFSSNIPSRNRLWSLITLPGLILRLELARYVDRFYDQDTHNRN